MSLDLVVLAGGRSTRFGSVKQLAPLGPNGEVLLDYAVHDAVRAGVDHVVLVIPPALEPQARRHVADTFGGVVAVTFAAQDTAPGRRKPWGTADAVRAAAPAVRGPFLVVNADDYYGPEAFPPLAAVLVEAETRVPEFAVAGYVLRDTLHSGGGVSRAVCDVDGEGFLTSITEVRGLVQRADGVCEGRDSAGVVRSFTGLEPVSTNLWGFTPALFPLLEDAFAAFRARRPPDDDEFLLSTEVDALVRRRRIRVRVVQGSGEFFGVTHADDAPGVAERLRALAAAGRYPATLWGAADGRTRGH